MLTTLYIYFSNAQGQLNSLVGERILQKFKLIHAVMIVLVTCKNNGDPFKNESTRVLTTFLPL